MRTMVGALPSVTQTYESGGCSPTIGSNYAGNTPNVGFTSYFSAW